MISSISLTNEIKSSGKLDVQINVGAREVQGAWIIIAGARADYDKQELIDNGCNYTYRVLINRGYTAGNIYYIGNKSYPIIDNASSRANIEWAIETWAASKCDSAHGLGIYLFDHGGENYLCLPGPDLTASDLDTYLDNFEIKSGCDRVIIIYEACRSGSFIDELSESNRIIITATDRTHSSYVNGDWTFAAFSEGFWNSIINCNTIGEAFEDAVENVEELGYGNSQFSLIDDNHDQIGHEVDDSGELPNGGDGDDALDTTIGYSLPCYLKLYLYAWPRVIFYPPTVNRITLWCKVYNLTKIMMVYARVIPPTWVPPPPENDTGEGVRFTGLSTDNIIPLYDYDHDGNYTANPKTDIVRQKWGWNTSNNTLKINFIAVSEDGMYRDLGTTRYIMTSDGNPPPDNTPPTIKINAPDKNETMTGVVNIDVEADDDQSVYKISIYLDGKLIKANQMPPYHPYQSEVSLNTASYPNGIHNITTIAWDSAGNSKSASILVNFQNKMVPGFQIVPIIIGCLLIILPVYVLTKRKKSPLFI